MVTMHIRRVHCNQLKSKMLKSESGLELFHGNMYKISNPHRMVALPLWLNSHMAKHKEIVLCDASPDEAP